MLGGVERDDDDDTYEFTSRGWWRPGPERGRRANAAAPRRSRAVGRRSDSTLDSRFISDTTRHPYPGQPIPNHRIEPNLRADRSRLSFVVPWQRTVKLRRVA